MTTPSKPSRNTLPCEASSRAASEPLWGTAPHAEHWILLEHSGTWAPKPLESAGLSSDIVDRLTEWQTLLSPCRIQLIRKPQLRKPELRKPELRKPIPEQQRALFLARTSSAGSSLWSWTLNTLDDLLDVQLPGASGSSSASRDVASDDPAKNEPLYLVCTHGKRDPCCARLGNSVYQSLAALTANVWQTTHVGGHRFAANVVSLPAGACYGRVQANEAQSLLDAEARGELYRLDRFRGLCGYPPPAQAAHAFALERSGARHYQAELALAPRSAEPTYVAVRLGGETQHIAVQEEVLARPIVKSCGEEPVTLQRFRFEDAPSPSSAFAD